MYPAPSKGVVGWRCPSGKQMYDYEREVTVDQRIMIWMTDGYFLIRE
jgi:hypothetical protein